jgi:anaerobic selenocysteine-containing dehydrogenase
MTNSARWLQWKNVALPPPGAARLDQDIVSQIFLKVREVFKNVRWHPPRSKPLSSF